MGSYPGCVLTDIRWLTRVSDQESPFPHLLTKDLRDKNWTFLQGKQTLCYGVMTSKGCCEDK